MQVYITFIANGESFSTLRIKTEFYPNSHVNFCFTKLHNILIQLLLNKFDLSHKLHELAWHIYVKNRHSYEFYFTRLAIFQLSRGRIARFMTESRACIIHDDVGTYLSGLCFTYWIRYSIYRAERKPLLSVCAHLVSNIPIIDRDTCMPKDYELHCPLPRRADIPDASRRN